MNKLSQTHENVLRRLVALCRERRCPEEFTVIGLQQGPMVIEAKEVIQDLSELCITLLVDSGFLFVNEHPHKVGGSTYTCYVTPAGYLAVDRNFGPTEDIQVTRTPVEISESLARFRSDYPDSNKLAFVMMKFGRTPAHTAIHLAIQNALEPHGLVALRADDKEYHSDVLNNILTYIYGVRFGIAVFERLQSNDFNPNVSLEVGYMMGLRKPVCLIKDETINILQTDLVGQLYRSFDPQNPQETIPRQLGNWMRDKNYIS